MLNFHAHIYTINFAMRDALSKEIPKGISGVYPMESSIAIRQQFFMRKFQHWNNDEWSWERFRAAPLSFHIMATVAVFGSLSILGWVALLIISGSRA